MVTKPNTRMPVSGEDPLQKLPKVAPPQAVSGFAFPGQSAANPTDEQPKSFKLPNKLTTAEVKDNSFNYGGGRTAGGGTPGAPVRAGRRS